MLRLFAAVAVPHEIASALAPHQTGLRGARWRPAEALHVTLRFFGELQERAAEDLDSALGAVSVPPFSVALQGAGSFGEGDHQRAVWAGVAACPPLERLAAKCETAARRAGLKAESRRYTPHVTLAYLPRTANPVAVAEWKLQQAGLVTPPFHVVAFGLYSSWQTPEGSRYELERRYALA